MKATKDLLVGVDEFTLVLQAKEKVDVMIWFGTVRIMLDRFLYLSKIESIFGTLNHSSEKKVVQGYTHGIFAENHPFYFVICFHEYMQNMGLCIRFSSNAWAYFQAEYTSKYQSEMNVMRFLKMVQSNVDYTMRLSRIDFTADYKNHGLNVDHIYQCLKSKKLHIRNWKLNRVNLNMSSVEKDGIAETIYLGSRKENSQGFLRIYDKRKEQISSHGFRMNEALETNDWLRMEAVFKGKRAHQITTNLLNEVNNADELQQFIAQMITDKYLFFDVERDDVTDFTDELFAITQGSDFSHLRTESPRDNALKQSIRYLVTNAGLFPVIYKIAVLYGDEGVQEFWQYLQEQYQYYTPNRDTEIWLNKHWVTMLNQPLSESLGTNRDVNSQVISD